MKTHSNKSKQLLRKITISISSAQYAEFQKLSNKTQHSLSKLLTLAANHIYFDDTLKLLPDAHSVVFKMLMSKAPKVNPTDIERAPAPKKQLKKPKKSRKKKEPVKQGKCPKLNINLFNDELEKLQHTADELIPLFDVYEREWNATDGKPRPLADILDDLRANYKKESDGYDA